MTFRVFLFSLLATRIDQQTQECEQFRQEKSPQSGTRPPQLRFLIDSETIKRLRPQLPRYIAILGAFRTICLLRRKRLLISKPLVRNQCVHLSTNASPIRSYPIVCHASAILARQSSFLTILIRSFVLCDDSVSITLSDLVLHEIFRVQESFSTIPSS